MQSTNLFSDSWHKVSHLHVCLLSSVSVIKQTFRGEDRYVLQDGYNNKYFTLSKEAYRFVSNLSLDKTIQDVVDEMLQHNQDDTPSQNEIIDLISSLHENNLLFFKSIAQNEFIHQRKEEKKYKENKNKIFSFMFFKVPLYNPNSLLNRYKSAIDTMFSRVGFVVWILVCLCGLKIFVENFDLVYSGAEGMIAPSNLILLYICMALLKLLHEISHSCMIKKYGGSVNTMGVMFVILTPLPYVDATNSCFFSDKYKKVLVSFAGMMSDLFFASIATIIWALSGEGLVHSIAFNIMIIGSVSSVLFNGNPLLKFDAYYMLIDYLEIPNLFTKSRDYIYYLCEKYIFKIENVYDPSKSQKEAYWLFGYAISSYIYRLLISIGLIFYVADQFFVLGILMAVLSIYMWVINPLKQYLHYLFYAPKLYKQKNRAIAISSAVFGSVLCVVFFVPLSYSIKAPGVVQTNNSLNVYAKTDGIVEKIFVKSGDKVQKGDVIAILKNQDIVLDIQEIQASLNQVESVRQKFLYQSSNDIKALNEKKDVLLNKLAYLQEKQNNLTIKADISGTFVSSTFDTQQYSYIKRQTNIGKIINDEVLSFFAVVSQEGAYELFATKQVINSTIKLFGNSDNKYQLSQVQVIPSAKDKLPSSALGWFGGGDISVEAGDIDGKKTTELFFEINGRIIADTKNKEVFKDGRTGIVKIELEKTPLIQQIYTKINQLLQKRYKI